jgi:hypothetical protein
LRTNYRISAVIQGILFIGLIAIFLLGLIELFQMRFGAGDIYPVYSSLRADPLGTKAYYDALGRIRSISTERNYKPLPKLSSDSTLFILGADRKAADFIPEEEVKVLESFISGGGRLVMTFLPARSMPQAPGEGKEHPKHSEKKTGTSLCQRWGFTLSSKKSESGQRPDAVIAGNGYPLPPSVPWHTVVFFDPIDLGWEPIYKSADRPVMIERKYGKGTIVLATDTYFASNEAMLGDRRPELLSWLAGPHKEIVFDETHNGILENPGLASLFRKYNLHGLFAGFILLAGLYVWKNSLGLVPARTAENAEVPDSTSGKDHLSGMISLLRRNVPPRQVLSVCVHEWRKGLPKTAISGKKMEKVEKAAEAFNDKSINKELQVSSYKFIVNLLSERMNHGK